MADLLEDMGAEEWLNKKYGLENVTASAQAGGSTPRTITTKDQRDEWLKLRHEGMASAVGEYTPEEFWDLLSDVDNLVAAIESHSMGTKRNDSCLKKVGDDEPIFVLRAQDMLAPDLVRQWAVYASFNDCPEEKVQEALDIADRMEAWSNRKMPD